MDNNVDLQAVCSRLKSGVYSYTDILTACQFIEDSISTSTSKTCTTCLHADTGFFSPPCVNCDVIYKNVFSHWEKK